MSEQLAIINNLAPIAVELRERQDVIDSKLRQWHGITADLVLEASEQGRSIINAKHHLGGRLKWSDWLHAHVPNLSEDQAAKYERIATEQLRDPRQCVFAFLPPPEHEHIERMKPALWELGWGYLSKFVRVADDFGKWPPQQVELARQELEPVAKRLWPERFI